jgi:fructosamine-3-kinase
MCIRVTSGWRDRRLIAALVAALLLPACGGEMKQSELADSIETIESNAAEGSLLASHAYTDRTKTTFVRARARELGESLDHEAEKLNDADAGADVAADKQRAIDLADEIASQVGDLQTAPQDHAAARAIGTRLRELADAAAALREHL